MISHLTYHLQVGSVRCGGWGAIRPVYVSGTGAIVYWMLYHLYGPA